MKTACGIDALMVVCSYVDGESCFYPSGPCAVGKHNREMQKEGAVECVGSSALGSHLPSEETTRLNFHHKQEVGKALSVAVEALCTMASRRYDDATERSEIYTEALLKIRQHVGHEYRLTTMAITCAWCGKSMGDKEGNGATGETSTICPACFDIQHAAIAPEPTVAAA